jgi:hypothetical protein
LEPIALNAQYGLAWLMQADAPAAAAAFLDHIIAHQAVEHATHERALRLQQTLTTA